MGDAEGIKTLVPSQIRYQGLEEGYPDMDYKVSLYRRESLKKGSPVFDATLTPIHTQDSAIE